MGEVDLDWVLVEEKGSEGAEASGGRSFGSSGEGLRWGTPGSVKGIQPTGELDSLATSLGPTPEL